jgi:hypothetical protein
VVRPTTCVAAVTSPRIWRIFGSFTVLDGIAEAAVGSSGPAWLAGEAGILATAVVWLVASGSSIAASSKTVPAR